MKAAHMHLLTMLHDHLHRLVPAKEARIAKMVYLLMAREICRTTLLFQHHPLAIMVGKLERHITDPTDINDVMSYVWVCDDVRDQSAQSDKEKVIKLLRRATENFGDGWDTESSLYLVKEFAMQTLYDVSAFLDSPVMMATTADLLKFRIWFGGSLDKDGDCYVRLHRDIPSVEEWYALCEQYPDTGYMWRSSRGPLSTGLLNTFQKDRSGYWKNVSIMDYSKLRKKAEARLLTEDYERRELFTVMPSEV